MDTGEDLTLAAMKRDFKRLSRIADKAKAECDECMSIGSEMLSIHEEFAAIVEAKERGPKVIKKLDGLKTRSEKADKIRKKDLIKLMDRESETAITRDTLGHEIQMLEFRLGMRSRKAT